MDYRDGAPEILIEFLTFHETIKGHSKKTVDEYFLDLRSFFRFLKILRLHLDLSRFDEITIQDVDLTFLSRVTLTEVYEYMSYLSRDRKKHPNSDQSAYGLDEAARARKVASIRSFFKYLTVKTHKLETNPVQDLDAPKTKKTLPRYLTLSQSLDLLEAVDGQNRERDYCILTLLLNCGLRISEVVGLNLHDVRDDTVRVLGKGNKERILYLNAACREALDGYLVVRRTLHPPDKQALFISRLNKRIGTQTVHLLVKKHLRAAGLNTDVYSTHKLRHTAATLMLQNGVDIRTLQELLGHDHLNTTQIYTHIDAAELREAAMANPLAHQKQKKKVSDMLEGR